MQYGLHPAAILFSRNAKKGVIYASIVHCYIVNRLNVYRELAQPIGYRRKRNFKLLHQPFATLMS